MRWTGWNGSRRGTAALILGHPVHSIYLRTEKLRFCPRCLADDGPPEQRIHRQAWQVLLICACPRHATLLLEACDDCGAPIEQALKTKPWCCACGKDMARMGTVAAPEGAIAIAAALVSGLSGVVSPPSGDGFAGRAFPAPFGDLSLDSLLTIIAKLGMLALSQNGDAPVDAAERLYVGAPIRHDMSCREAADLVAAAYDVIRGWPYSASSLFAALADRNPAPPTSHPLHAIFATRAGYRLLGRVKSIDGEIIRVIDDALEDWLFHERGIYIDGRQRPKVAADGDTAIDVADALRRLEGRNASSVRITAWVEAEAVIMIGNKVSLVSVEDARGRLSNLEEAALDDAMPSSEWATRFLYNPSYRRTHAIRDILAGSIRVRRNADGSGEGLSALEVSRSDFVRRARDAGVAERKHKQSPEQRALRARERDAFYRSGKVYALLQELWPARTIPDIVEHPYVRCRTKTFRYPGREMKQRFYSVADALDLMSTQRSNQPAAEAHGDGAA